MATLLKARELQLLEYIKRYPAAIHLARESQNLKTCLSQKPKEQAEELSHTLEYMYRLHFHYLEFLETIINGNEPLLETHLVFLLLKIKSNPAQNLDQFLQDFYRLFDQTPFNEVLDDIASQIASSQSEATKWLCLGALAFCLAIAASVAIIATIHALPVIGLMMAFSIVCALIPAGLIVDSILDLIRLHNKANRVKGQIDRLDNIQKDYSDSIMPNDLEQRNRPEEASEAAAPTPEQGEQHTSAALRNRFFNMCALDQDRTLSQVVQTKLADVESASPLLI